MPRYTIRDPRTGRTVTLEGPSPPTEAELEQVFATVNAQGGPPRVPPQSPEAPETPERSWTDTAVDALPMIGGTAGGIVGGIGGTAFGMGVGGVPGAVGGATLGGAAGESAKQLIERFTGEAGAPQTSGEAAKDIALQGGIQGGAEIAGAGLMRGAGAIGRSFIENAVRPPLGLVREFPNVMDTIIKERLPVGRGLLPGAKSGSVQAAEKLGAAARSVKALLTRATAKGTTYSADEVATPVLDLIDDLAKQPLGDAQEKQLSGMITEFLRRHKGPLTPLAVKELKQRAQAIAKPIYKAAEKGFPVTADQSLSARFNSAIASGAKSSLEKIPNVATGEARTQSLIGAQRAIKQAEGRRLPLAAEGISGAAAVVGSMLQPGGGLDDRLRNGAIAWLVARGLASPRSISRQGLVLSADATKQLLRQFPRLATAVAAELSASPSVEIQESK